MKALVGAFNQEKALVGAFSVIVQPVVEPMDRFAALMETNLFNTNTFWGTVDGAQAMSDHVTGWSPFPLSSPPTNDFPSGTEFTCCKVHDLTRRKFFFNFKLKQQQLSTLSDLSKLVESKTFDFCFRYFHRQ